MTSEVDISLTEIQARAYAARYGDLGDYSVAVHDWHTEPYQDAWDLALETENKLLIICPPDTFKSSTIQCWIERAIGLNPDIRILWLMNAGEQSTNRLLAVAETLESNEVYREAFSVVPDYDKKWTQTTLFVKRARKSSDPTLMGCGLNGPYQGLHFDIIIVDDPTDQDDVHSPTTMDRQRAKLRGVILDRLVLGGRMVGIMTRWGEDDLVPTFKEIGFRIVKMPVMGDYPWGPTISNTRFSLARCAQLRHEKTDAIFDLTYMCDPSEVEGGIILKKYLKYWTNEMIPQTGTVTLMAIDPAASTKTRADGSAIAIGILELKTRDLFITNCYADRREVPDLEADIVRHAKQTANMAGIALETKGFQISMLQRMRRENNLPFRELQYRTKRQAMLKVAGLDNDKTARAVSLAQSFSKSGGGTIYLPPYQLPYFDGVSLESELCGFPFGKHDDRLDTLCFLRALADTYSPAKLRVRLGK